MKLKKRVFAVGISLVIAQNTIASGIPGVDAAKHMTSQVMILLEEQLFKQVTAMAGGMLNLSSNIADAESQQELEVETASAIEKNRVNTEIDNINAVASNIPAVDSCRMYAISAAYSDSSESISRRQIRFPDTKLSDQLSFNKQHDANSAKLEIDDVVVSDFKNMHEMASYAARSNSTALSASVGMLDGFMDNVYTDYANQSEIYSSLLLGDAGYVGDVLDFRADSIETLGVTKGILKRIARAAIVKEALDMVMESKKPIDGVFLTIDDLSMLLNLDKDSEFVRELYDEQRGTSRQLPLSQELLMRISTSGPFVSASSITQTEKTEELTSMQRRDLVLAAAKAAQAELRYKLASAKLMTSSLDIVGKLSQVDNQ